MFAQLSVFAGGWSLEGLEAVAAGGGLDQNELLDVLERLIDKSLVLAEDPRDQPRRYKLLEPLRQFAAQRLEEQGQLRATQGRHARFFMALFEDARQRAVRLGPTPAFPVRLDPEQGNLRAALRWFINERDLEGAQRLASGARWFWFYVSCHGGLICSRTSACWRCTKGICRLRNQPPAVAWRSTDSSVRGTEPRGHSRTSAELRCYAGSSARRGGCWKKRAPSLGPTRTSA